MRRLILLTVAVLRTATVFSQWTYSLAPYGRHLNDVVTLSPTSFTAVGGNPTNDALQSVFSPSQTFPFWNIHLDVFGDWLHCASYINSQVGFVAGDNGAMLKTTDGSLTWTTIAVPTEAADKHIRGIRFLNAQTGYAVGGAFGDEPSRIIMKTVNGGADWEVQVNGPGEGLRDVSFPNASTGIAVGDVGTVLRTTDGGANWAPVSIPSQVSERDFQSVTMLNASVGLIMGGSMDGDQMQTILRTSDGGANWTVIHDVSGYMLRGGCFASNSNAYAVGNRGTVLRSTDSGLLWDVLQIAPEVNDTNDLNAVHFLNADFGTAVGRMGKVLRFSNPDVTTSMIQTGMASELTTSSARLNATVDANGPVTTVSFEYGPTPALGFSVTSTPSFLSGYGWQSVHADLDDITTPGLNYFRAVAENSAGTVAGTVRPFYIGEPEIPNWDFELWDTVYTERPSLWTSGGNTTKVLSYDGSWANQLSTQTMEADRSEGGFVVFGIVEGGDEFMPVLPFNHRPDSIVAHLNYDIVPNDTALLLLILTKEGQTMAFDVHRFTGGTGGEFIRYGFPIGYLGEETPDSMLIGIVNTNALSDTAFDGSVLRVDNVHFPGLDYELPNGDFEQWEWRAREYAVGWRSSEDHRTDSTLMVYKSIDSQSGLYAMRLANEMPNNWRGSVNLRTQQQSSQLYGPSFPVSQRYTQFNGYMKRDLQNDDTLRITVALFQNGEAICHRTANLTESNTEYEPFIIPLEYQTPGSVPDSAHIEFGFTDTLARGSVVLIDNLGFDGFRGAIPDLVVSREDPVKEEGVRIIAYPNPVRGLLNVTFSRPAETSLEIVLMDMRGTTVLREHLPQGTLSTTIDAGRSGQLG